MMRRIFTLCLIICLTACAGVQNAMAGDGPDGARFIDLFVFFTVVCTLMYLLIAAALLAVLWRRRGARLTVEDRRHHETSAVVKPALIGWMALVVVGLTVLTVASFFTDRSNAADARQPALLVKVTANQWWWDVEYSPGDPSKTVRTANEIHLPLGVPVRVTLTSNDVIHSFWVPNLAGKQDLIPGRTTDVRLLASKTGLYRGQCAEFCGVQHARMALDVTVESKADFQRWYAAQLKPAASPAMPLELTGYRYVTTRECGTCHNIAGTPAGGRVAPELTHFASRRSIAAGTLPMSKGNLYGWIADPQSQKPGSHMPTVGLEPAELHSVVAYLERLK
jgi:cytochrome c oxidase subunit II